MKEIELTIHNPSGLHARPAKVFVNTAKKFKSKIKLQHGTKKNQCQEHDLYFDPGCGKRGTYSAHR